MSIQDTEQVIMNIAMDMAEDPEGVYNDVMCTSSNQLRHFSLNP